MSSFLTCPKGHRWQAYDLAEPDTTRPMLVCPECGLQPETIPPLDRPGLELKETTGTLALAAGVPYTAMIQPSIDSPTQGAAPTFPSQAVETVVRLAGVRVHGYEILEELGRGGMGVVYKARQEALKRLVALKMILSAGHASAAEFSRFLIEAEAVARLHHPNIVQIYQVGDHDGRPFLALEFVEGGSMAERLDGTPVPPRLAAQLVIQLAQAMQHAHEHGIVHRDLKPANILLALRRGPNAPVPKSANDSTEPSSRLKTAGPEKEPPVEHWAANTIPKITDFGLAKRLDSELGETKSGAIMGTPNYMAPEQARGKKEEVGPATDIYALGAILYELITGRPPFCGESPLDTLRLATTEEPVPPARLQPGCPRDLDTICLKCLEKEPSNRYASAGELAQELERMLKSEPILARPTSRLERGLKWSRRHPAGAALLALSMLVLVAVIGFGSFYSAEQHFKSVELQKALAATKSERDRANDAAEAEKAATGRVREEIGKTMKALELANDAAKSEKLATEKAVQEEYKARRLLYDVHMSLAYREWQMAHVDRVLQLLQEQTTSRLNEFRGFEWFYLDRLCHSDVQTLSNDSGTVWSVAFSPDGTQLVSAAGKLAGRADVKVWDLRTSKPILTFPLHFGRVSSVAYRPGGRVIASAGMDPERRPVVFLWDAKTGKVLGGGTLYGHRAEIYGMAFSPDGKKLATASYDKTVRVWDVDTGKILFTFTGEVNFNSVAFSADGRWVAAGSSDQVVKIWDVSSDPPVQDQRPVHTLHGHVGKVLCVVFSPDGERIATSGIDQTVRLWSARTGVELVTLRLHPVKVEKLAFSPDGKILAGSDDRSTIKLWEVQTGAEVGVYRGNSGAINCLEFSPQGQWLVSAGSDPIIHIWDTARGQEAVTLRGHANLVRAVFQPGRDRLASGSFDGTIRIWDVNNGRSLYTFGGQLDRVLGLVFDPQGKILASAGGDHMVHLWDMQVPYEWLEEPERRALGAFAGGWTGPLAPLPWLLLKQESPQIVQTLRGHEDDVTCVAFAPDGRHLASGSLDRTIRIWNVATGKETLVLRSHKSAVDGLTFSPDGTLLAAATADGNAVLIWKVFSLEDDQPQVELWHVLFGHTDQVTTVAFTPDGKYLASGSADGTVRIWDVNKDAKDALVSVLLGHRGGVNSLAFTPDGKRLATASDDLTVKLWDMLDVTSPEETLSLQSHTQEVVSVSFGYRGQRLATGSRDGTVKIWDARPVVRTKR